MKKNIVLWSLYDFANSIVMIVFLFYFSQRLVIEQHVSELRYNLSLVAASVLFILVAPYLGKLVDQGASKIRGLRIWTVISVLLFALVGSITLWAPQYVFLAGVGYSIAMAAYLVCFVYYTPMLNDLATHDNYGQISGRGQSVNLLGQILGLVITIPILHGALPFLGASRASTLLPAVFLFLIFSLPMLISYNVTDKPLPAQQAKIPFWKSFKELFGYKAIVLFLVGYFLYSDALLTFSSNFPLYLEKVHHIMDTGKSLLTALILFIGCLSAFFMGKWTDKKGLKKSLLVLLIGWCIVFPVFVFVQGFTGLVIMSCIAGVIRGPTWSVSRALFSKIIPKHLTARGFSFFTIAERFSTLVGPLVWGGVVTGLGGSALGYQWALVSMAVLVILGWWATEKID